MSFDTTTKMSQLQEFWISRASSEQRKGRAGLLCPKIKTASALLTRDSAWIIVIALGIMALA